MMRLRVEKKINQSKWGSILYPILFAVLALVFSSVFILAIQFNPIQVYGKMMVKMFFDINGIQRSIIGSLPLIMCSLGVAFAFKMNLNNIGAEGQYAVGAICGGAAALCLPEMTAALKLILIFLACFAGGAVCGLLAAIPKALFNVNEIIITLMLNYITLLFMDYLCYGPWKEKGKNVGQTIKIAEELRLGTIPGTSINIGLLLGILAAVIIYLFFKFTTGGFEVSVIGQHMEAAKYAGMNVKKNILTVLCVSGGLAGLAGFIQLTGVVHRVTANMPNNAGYTAIVIAYLSRFNPLAIIIVSILISGLQNSSATVQVMGVPSEISMMLQGTLMLFVIAGEFFYQNKIVFKKKGGAIL